jgi:hypothetical protein
MGVGNGWIFDDVMLLWLFECRDLFGFHRKKLQSSDGLQFFLEMVVVKKGEGPCRDA